MEKSAKNRILRSETAALFALLDRADDLFALAKSPEDLNRLSRLAFQEIECRRYARSLDLAGFGSEVAELDDTRLESEKSTIPPEPR